MTIVLDNPDQLTGIFDELSRQFNEISYVEPLTAFQHELAEGERQAFASGVSPGGDIWPLNAPSTVRMKGHSQVLVDTGRLGLSLTSVEGPGNISVIGERGSIFGTDVEYSIFNMERRPHVGTNEAGVDKLSSMLADYVVESLRE